MVWIKTGGIHLSLSLTNQWPHHHTSNSIVPSAAKVHHAGATLVADSDKDRPPITVGGRCTSDAVVRQVVRRRVPQPTHPSQSCSLDVE